MALPDAKKNGNYLRVRGEYATTGRGISRALELPPRARRIRLGCTQSSPTVGTTSACAENTTQKPQMRSSTRNYLRVRGEYRNALSSQHSHRELPPRARRILNRRRRPAGTTGTTSACAENTHTHTMYMFREGNYLRVRGEYTPTRTLAVPGWELPPRARRIRAAVKPPHGERVN